MMSGAKRSSLVSSLPNRQQPNADKFFPAGLMTKKMLRLVGRRLARLAPSRAAPVKMLRPSRVLSTETKASSSTNIWGVDASVLDSLPEAKREGMLRRVSAETASESEKLQLKVNAAIKKWRKHEADVGSPAVSIAAMSERINHLRKHMRQHHKDKHSMYGINALINKRRYMLKYLSRKDFPSFKALMNEYEITNLELMTDQGASHRGWTERNARRRARRGKRVFPPYHNVE
jgi:small subunit ribosomal protein S15